MTSTSSQPAGLLTSLADREIIGHRYPIRFAHTVPPTNSDFLKMMISLGRSTVESEPHNSEARLQLGTAALAFSAARARAGILVWPLDESTAHAYFEEGFELSKLAAEQFLHIVSSFHPIPLPYEQLAAAAAFYNGSVIFHLGGNEENAIACLNLAIDQASAVRPDDDLSSKSKATVAAAIERHGQDLGRQTRHHEIS